MKLSELKWAKNITSLNLEYRHKKIVIIQIKVHCFSENK